jgi:hypothetical protein
MIASPPAPAAPPGSPLGAPLGAPAGAAPTRPVAALLAAAGATALLWQVPYGDTLLFPFTVLATWFHEMGHGLTALALGGELESLRLHADGSGLASWRGVGFGRFAAALVAAGGPLGPAIAGAGLVLSGRGPRSSRFALVALAAVLALSALLWVRSLFGFVAVLLLAAAIGALAGWAPRWARGFAVQLLGVQACISTYRQVDYLFARAVVIDGQAVLSDSGQIASALFLPWWFWGAALTVGCAALLLASLALAYGAGRPRRTVASGPSAAGR